jgi:hypothetical protein
VDSVQISGEPQQIRTVLNRLPHAFGKRRATVFAATGAGYGNSLMLRNNHLGNGHLEYLSATDRIGSDIGEVCLTIRAAIGMMHHNLIGLGDRLQSRTVMPRLATDLLAALLAKARGHWLKRLFAQTIARRRLRRVTGVFGYLFLKLRQTKQNLLDLRKNSILALKPKPIKFVTGKRHSRLNQIL